MKQLPYVDRDGRSHYVMGKYFLQDMRELEEFCLFMKDKRVKDYVEVGVFRGQLLNYMKRKFNLNRCIGFDRTHPSVERKSEGYICYEEEPVEPLLSDIEINICDSHSWEYVAQRQKIGDVDLVFIDACHDLSSVFQDILVEFAINRTRYIALHDIAWWNGPKMAWDRLDESLKLFSVSHPNPIGGMGIGVLRGPREGGNLLFKDVQSWDRSIR